MLVCVTRRHDEGRGEHGPLGTLDKFGFIHVQQNMLAFEVYHSES